MFVLSKRNNNTKITNIMYQTPTTKVPSTVAIALVKTLNDLVTRFSSGEHEINYTELRNLEKFIANEGIDLCEVYTYLNNQ